MLKRGYGKDKHFDTVRRTFTCICERVFCPCLYFMVPWKQEMNAGHVQFKHILFNNKKWDWAKVIQHCPLPSRPDVPKESGFRVLEDQKLFFWSDKVFTLILKNPPDEKYGLGKQDRASRSVDSSACEREVR